MPVEEDIFKYKIQNREQRKENREQRIENREQRIENSFEKWNRDKIRKKKKKMGKMSWEKRYA